VGGGSRLGAAIAVAVAERGAEVVIAARTPSHGARRSFGESVASIHVDLSDPTTIERMGETIGPFDHLVSTVSMHATGRLVDLTDADIMRSVDAKILGPIRLAKATGHLIRPGGSMTFFSGAAAWRPSAGGAITATVNGALAFLVQALAVELAPVRVNAIAPGLIDSGALDVLGEERKAAIIGAAAERNPVGRAGVPEDVLSATLMTMRNGYMTGTTVHVDGGGTLT
jgi:NAD(P)-dependent dehydrogenase (short-subunit alcohol dehydrogenase family)